MRFKVKSEILCDGFIYPKNYVCNNSVECFITLDSSSQTVDCIPCDISSNIQLDLPSGWTQDYRGRLMCSTCVETQKIEQAKYEKEVEKKWKRNKQKKENKK